jgi:hypothetical protein
MAPMRPSSKLFLTALVLYLVLGIGYQIWTCATWSSSLGQDGLPPDIPCAGIPWTILVVGLWPANSFSELRSGHPLAAASLVAAFGLVILLFALGLRKAGQR